MPPKPKQKKGEDDLLDLKDLPKANYFITKLQYNFLKLKNRQTIYQSIHSYDHPLVRFLTLAEAKDAGLRRGAIPEEPPEGTEIPVPQLAKSIAAKIYEILGQGMSEKDTRIKAVKAKEEAQKEAEANANKKEEKTKAPAKKAEAPKDKKAEGKKGQKADIGVFEKFNFFPTENEIDMVIVFEDIPMKEELLKALADEGYAINAITEIKEKLPIVEQPVVYNKKTANEESKNLEKTENAEGEEEEQKEIPPPKAEPTEEEKKQKEDEDKKKAEEAKVEMETLEKEKTESKENAKLLKKLALQSNIGSPLRECNEIIIDFIEQTGKPAEEEDKKEDDKEAKKDPIADLLKEVASKLIDYGKLYVQYHATKTKISKLLFGKKVEKPSPVKPPIEEENKPKYDTSAVCPYENYKAVNTDDEDALSFDKTYIEKKFTEISPEKVECMHYLSLCLDQLLRKANQYIKKEIDESENINNLFSQYESKALPSSEKKDSQAKVVEKAKPQSKYSIVHSANNKIWTQFFNDSKSINHISRIVAIIQKILVPGINRQNMPEMPTYSTELRGAMAAEIIPFFDCTREELHRFMLIMEFEKMFREKFTTTKWNFGHRVYEEELTNDELMHRLEGIMAFESDMLYKYDERTDSLLLAAYFHTPKGRILRKKKLLPSRNWPNLNRFVNFAKLTPNYQQGSYWELDDNKVGDISERIKLMYPSDGSLIKISKISISSKIIPIVTIAKDQFLFGMTANADDTGSFWLNFDGGSKLKVDMINKGACMTYTLPNNAIIKVLPNADILMINDDDCRVITGKGSVIKYLKNGRKEMLFANGNYAEHANGCLITTNNKGQRRKKINAEESEADPIPCAHRTDAETLAKIMVRDDDVTTVKFVDGRLYTRHRDGTKMFTSENSDEIIVECPGFAPVKISIDRIKARAKQIIAKGSADALMGSDNVMARSNDGKVSRVFLPDGTVLETFRETQETDTKDQFTINTITLIRRVDLSIVKIKEDGEVVIVTSNQRMALNNLGQKKELGSDIDFFFELFGTSDERKPGVYTCRCAQSEISMVDDEGNRYIVYGNGTSAEKISISFNLDQKERPSTPVFDGEEYVEEACKFFPEPKIAIEPRLFVIRNDGTGFEILQNNYYEYYMRSMKFAKAHMSKLGSTFSIIQQIGNQHNNDFLSGIKLPKIVDITESTPLIKNEPNTQYFTHRKIEQRAPLTDRDKYLASYKKYTDWVEEKKQRANKFCIKDTRAKEEIAESLRIQALIYKQRKSKEKTNDIDEDGILLNEYFKDDDRTDEIKDPILELLRQQGNLMGPRTYKRIVKEEKIAGDNTLSESGAKPLSRESRASKSKAEKPSEKSMPEVSYQYFNSAKGKEFLAKTLPDPNASSKIKERLEKSKIIEEKAEENPQQESKQEDDNEKSNPIVVLETDAPKRSKKNPPQITPSAYNNMQKQITEMDHEKYLQSEQYHIIKTKEFDVTGKPRESKPFVKTIARPNVAKDLNEKYIMIDMFTDKRVKTTSMSNRIFIKAPDIEILRKKGQHQMVETAIKKRQTYEELMMENNAMIEYALNDPNKRNLLINPAAVRFGTLKVGVEYHTSIIVKNEDVMPQRIFIKNPKYFKIKNTRPGPVLLLHRLHKELIQK